MRAFLSGHFRPRMFVAGALRWMVLAVLTMLAVADAFVARHIPIKSPPGQRARSVCMDPHRSRAEVPDWTPVWRARSWTGAASQLSSRSKEEDAASLGSDSDSDSGGMNISGVGSAGSNLLLGVTSIMVVKGLLLPEDVRHLSFCPTEDPVRGRDTLPWRMMVESGRECGTIPEVMTKYVTAPLAFPGTPEWGMMLNVKEDLAKTSWME